MLTVSELNRRAKGLLEANFELLWVAGEISNLTRAASGHWYFSLKDANAQVRCVMYRQRAQALDFLAENGQKVEVRALPSLYETRGEFQLGVEHMRRAGAGQLFEALERLKARLAAEGLFDAALKRPLPALPRTIGIVTSPAGAALRDVVTTLARRAPMIRLVIYPSAVQGANAGAELAAAVDTARARREVDVLIVCRGGGSLEDLWPFNDESLVRAMARLRAETSIATICGVGHETDVTLADFAADQRAATPTAAAELAAPEQAALAAGVRQAADRMRRALRRRLDLASQSVDWARRSLASPRERMALARQQLESRRRRLSGALARALHACAARLAALAARHRAGRPAIASARAAAQARRHTLVRAMRSRLAGAAGVRDARRRALLHLDPGNVLRRGYAIVMQAGGIVRDAARLHAGDAVQVRVAVGGFHATVEHVEEHVEGEPHAGAGRD